MHVERRAVERRGLEEEVGVGAPALKVAVVLVKVGREQALGDARYAGLEHLVGVHEDRREGRALGIFARAGLKVGKRGRELAHKVGLRVDVHPAVGQVVGHALVGIGAGLVVGRAVHEGGAGKRCILGVPRVVGLIGVRRHIERQRVGPVALVDVVGDPLLEGGQALLRHILVVLPDVVGHAGLRRLVRLLLEGGDPQLLKVLNARLKGRDVFALDLGVRVLHGVVVLARNGSLVGGCREARVRDAQGGKLGVAHAVERRGREIPGGIAVNHGNDLMHPVDEVARHELGARVVLKVVDVDVDRAKVVDILGVANGRAVFPVDEGVGLAVDHVGLRHREVLAIVFVGIPLACVVRLRGR